MSRSTLSRVLISIGLICGASVLVMAPGGGALAYDVTQSRNASSNDKNMSASSNGLPDAAFNALALDLIKAAADIGEFPEVTLLPRMRATTHEELEGRVCQKRCAVKAAYFPEEGILLDEALELDSSLLDRSIVLHELVHYLQERSGRYADLPPCKRWYAREEEAYWVQQVYLKRVRSGTTLSVQLNPQCPRESALLH